MAAGKRQTIIIGMAMLAVLYGLYDFMAGSRPKNGAAGPGSTGSAALQTFITQAAADLKNAQTDFTIAVVSAAERPWDRNPFFAREKASGRKSEFTYSGYLESGGRGLAIINHIEYQVGEELESRQGYFVKEITPSRVVIENRPAKTEIAVPLHD